MCIKKTIFYTGALFLSLPTSLYAAEGQTIEWLTLLMGLFGGLALFLGGLEQLSDGLKQAAGDALKTMLSKLTSNRFMGAVTGSVVTGILNSSSVTTVLVVGFVTAGVMTLQQSVGVIMGANIGSTVTAQLLAFNIAQYALLPIAVGFFMLFASKKDIIRNYGKMLMGLGLVFYGMGIMGDAMYPLRGYQPFLDILQRMENPLLGILAGAMFTGLVQSSAATVGIAIAMAGGGLLSLPAGIGLALGANIGTCVTALMAAMGKPPEAVRAAVVHVAFNVIGVLVWLPFISSLASIAVAISPPSPELEGVARIAAEVPRQIANANTLFNVINTIVFLPFTALFALVAERIVKERPAAPAVIEPLYLDSALLEVPTMALDGVRRELTRAAELLREMIQSFQGAMVTGDLVALRRLVNEDDKIDILEQASIEYLGKIRGNALSEQESDEHQRLMACAVNLETMADVIEKDLVGLAERSRRVVYQRSETSKQMLQEIFGYVSQAIDFLIPTIRDKDVESAEAILDLESRITRVGKAFLVRKSERLGNVPEAVTIARLEVSAVDKMERMYSLCKHIARTHLSEAE
ncbi:Na/Pi cotransporter family protein [Desulfopila aestuarii]|uniref:Phosphate:Na+ symporter n=1 Tax=Desulfopila aestuarii DSM 18488 TaxID=1121416 RepID=A0A1M7YCP7_9BACT|nr:Na/Pi cotransporter family protein [Desulfopila aestuarii]SHO50371.1 phosphate:Na+ symporter [Desulfopila aestuarii DSM 18488]